MGEQAVKRVRLQAELLLRRYGWLPIATGLAVGAAIWLHGVVTARLLAESQNHRAVLQTLSQRPPSPIDTPHSLADTRYAAFQARLTKRENLPEYATIAPELAAFKAHQIQDNHAGGNTTAD